MDIQSTALNFKSSNSKASHTGRQVPQDLESSERSPTEDSFTFSSTQDEDTGKFLGAVAGALVGGGLGLLGDSSYQTVACSSLGLHGAVSGMYAMGQLGEKVGSSLFEHPVAQYKWGTAGGFTGMFLGLGGGAATGAGLGIALSLLPTPLRVASSALVGAVLGGRAGGRMSS